MVPSVDYQKTPFEERYEIVRELGSGHFAVVRHCIEKATGDAYAVKFIRKRRQKFSRRGAAVEDIANEINLLNSLKHEHVIGLHEVFEDENHVLLVLELVSGGELFHYLSERDHLSEEDASKFVQQILRGLDHLHQHNVAHLDLKPENILLSSSESQIIKIIDFGLAKRLDPGAKEIKCMMGTAEFVAPEVVNYEPLSLQTDMWSVGVITYMLLSGSSPFAGQDQQETFSNITRAEFDFDEEVFSTTSDLAKDFIRKLLVREPKRRSTPRQALEHPWIRPRNPQQAVKRAASAINMIRLKAFAAKRRWQKSLRVIKLCNRLSKGNRPNSTASVISTSSTDALEMPDNFVTRAIFCAIEDGNRQGLERLLSMATVDLNSANDMGVTAAHVAAGAGRLQILQLLHVTYRLTLSVADGFGDYPLHWAARQGHRETVKYLLEAGVDPAAKNANQETALWQAVRYGHQCAFEDLLNTLDDASINTLNGDGDSLLHLAVWHGSSDSVLALLQSAKVNKNIQNAQMETTLHLCSGKGSLVCVEALIAFGADCNLQDLTGFVPLTTAIRNRQLEITQFLLPRTKLTVLDRDGCSVLFHAAEMGDIRAVDYMLQKFPDLVNKRSSRGVTGLHQAARHGHLEIVRLLCSRSADVEALDADGLSAEVAALLSGHSTVGLFFKSLGDAVWRSKLVNELRCKQGYLSRFTIRVLGHPRVGKTSFVKALQSSSVGSLVRRGSALFRRKSGKRTPPRSTSLTNLNQMRHGFPLFSTTNMSLTSELDVAVVELSSDPLCLQLYNHLLSYTGCLYIVMFSLAEPAATQRQQVSFWLRLLSLSCVTQEPIGFCGRPACFPVVLLVGTHADSVKCNKNADGVLNHPLALTLLENMKKHFGHELTIVPTVFIVENNATKNSANLMAIKSCLLSVGKQLRGYQTASSNLVKKVQDRLPLWRASKLLLTSSKWNEMLQTDINPLITANDGAVLIKQLVFMGEVIELAEEVPREEPRVVIAPNYLLNQLVMPFLYGQLQVKNSRHIFRPRDLHFVFSNYWHDTVEVIEALKVLGVCSQVGVGEKTVFEFPVLVDRTFPPPLPNPSLVVRISIPDLPSYPLLVFPRILAHIKSRTQSSRQLQPLQVMFRGARANDHVTLRWLPDEAIEIVAGGEDKSKTAPLLSELCAAVDQAIHAILPSALLEYTVFSDGQPLPLLNCDELEVNDLPLALVCRLCRLLDPKDPVGQDWCLLAVRLNVYSQLLPRVATANSSFPTESTTYLMLKEWISDVFPKPSVQQLLTGLQQIGREDVASVVRRFLPVYKCILAGSFSVSPSSPCEKTMSSMSSSVLSR